MQIYFGKILSAEVQIIDTSGQMLMDSMGNFTEGKIEGQDVEKALKGKTGAYIGKGQSK